MKKLPFQEVQQYAVRDFNTRDELIDHAKGEGATHVVVVGSGATLYFPTQGGKYEEARAWRQNGYWHAPAPGARKVVDRLPAGAEPIGAARKAAESTVGSRNFIAVEFDLRRGERTGNQMTFMANDLKDAAAKCAYTLNLKSAGWKVSPSGRTVQHKTGDIGWHIVEAGSPAARNMGVSETVRDYVAVDTRGRQVFGPTKDYGEAKRQADRAGGVVKFTSGQQPVASEATKRPSRGRGFQRGPGGGRRAGQMTPEWVMKLADELAREVDAPKPKPLPGGFRYSEKNESAQFTTSSPEYGQKIVVARLRLRGREHGAQLLLGREPVGDGPVREHLELHLHGRRTPRRWSRTSTGSRRPSTATPRAGSRRTTTR